MLITLLTLLLIICNWLPFMAFIIFGPCVLLCDALFIATLATHSFQLLGGDMRK